MFHRLSSKSEKSSIIPPIIKHNGFTDLSNIPNIKIKPVIASFQAKDQMFKIKNTQNKQSINQCNYERQIKNKRNQIIKNIHGRLHQKILFRDSANRKQNNYQKENNILKSIYQRRSIKSNNNRPISQRAQLINKNLIDKNIDQVKIQAFKEKSQNQNSQQQENAYNKRNMTTQLKYQKTNANNWNDIFLFKQKTKVREKIQSGFIKYQPNQNQKSFLYENKAANNNQEYKRPQSQYQRNNYVIKKYSPYKYSESTKIFKNQTNNKGQVSQIIKQQNERYQQIKQKVHSFKITKRPKLLESLKRDISKNSIKNNSSTSNGKDKKFIIKSKSKREITSKYHPYLDQKNILIDSNQNKSLIEEIILTRKRINSISNKNIKLTNQETSHSHQRKKSNDFQKSNNLNIQSNNKIQIKKRKNISVNRKAIEHIAIKKEQKHKNNKQSEKNNRKSTQKIFSINEVKKNNQENLQIVQDLNNLEKQNYIQKAFPKKKRRYIGCKLRRVQWGKSKQKDKQTQRIFNSQISLNLEQDFQISPLNENQIKKQIESQFTRQNMKVKTINLFQQLLNCQFSQVLSKISHDFADQPLQSLQELYKQL